MTGKPHDRPARGERWRLLALVVAAAVLSAGGVAYAVLVSGDPSDGGRGGALAVALTLVAFFLRWPLGERLATALTEKLPALERRIADFGEDDAATRNAYTLERRAVDLERRLHALEPASRVEAEGELRLNGHLALATAIGTLTWAFGDMAAAALV